MVPVNPKPFQVQVAHHPVDHIFSSRCHFVFCFDPVRACALSEGLKFTVCAIETFELIEFNRFVRSIVINVSDLGTPTYCIPSQVVQYICHPSSSWIASSMITFGNQCLKANHVHSSAQGHEINREKCSSEMGYVPLCASYKFPDRSPSLPGHIHRLMIDMAWYLQARVGPSSYRVEPKLNFTRTIHHSDPKDIQSYVMVKSGHVPIHCTYLFTSRSLHVERAVTKHSLKPTQSLHPSGWSTGQSSNRLKVVLYCRQEVWIQTFVYTRHVSWSLLNVCKVLSESVFIGNVRLDHDAQKKSWLLHILRQIIPV